MYDFSKFIDMLSDHNADPNQAFAMLNADFSIGKVEIKTLDTNECLEFVININYDKDSFLDYQNNGYNYRIYSISGDDKYNNREDLKTLLKLISINHINYLLTKRAKEAEFISYNTRLPNSHGFIREVSILLKRINPKDYYAYYINIKGFGLVNKLFGQQQGDLAIVSYANKLKEFIEEDEVLGHLGGDNFVALIKNKRHDDFIKLATMCPIKIKKDGIETVVNLIGIVGYCEIDDKDVIRSIMSNSSMACQYARNNKKIIVKHTQELEDVVNSVKNIESTFKEELDKGNFIVYYQPKFDIKSGKIIGVEALSRWINNGKVIAPGMFVPILEKNGDIVHLDLFILEKLCHDISNYRGLGYKIVPASCNLSRRDFENENLEDIIIGIIKKYNVKTEDIVIEVTETTNFEENERLSKFINKMHQNGIMTSIDDFGTGYSSLSVLRDFRVNEIKIDRSFINREVLTQSDEIIIGSIIDMAKRLNINVICEGVETNSQADFLIKLGCTNAQGFLYSKPVPKEEFESMMQKIGTVYD